MKRPAPLRGYSGVWQRYYTDRGALNLGFRGDGTRHLLWRIMHGEIDSIGPKAAAILIGTNDIGWLHRTAADTVAGIERAVAEVLLPSDRGSAVRQATAEINSALAAHYGNGQMPYMAYRDISAVFLKDRVLDTLLFSDPREVPLEPALHPSPEGRETDGCCA